MRCKEAWRPTKFVLIDGQLRGDPSGTHLSVGSRLLGDLVAPHYQAALKSCARGRLLDLGCGNVPLFEAYREMVDEVICVDWPQSLHQQQHVDAFADLTQPLPFADASFDTVVLSDVLEHIPDPENLLSEISRVLRPEGSVVIGVPFFYWLHEVPHDFNRYTRYQLERLIKRAGLQLVHLTEIGGSPEVIADVVGKTLARRPRVAAAFVAFARWVLKRGYVQRLSQQNRSQFPLAYILTARMTN
jgi:SAM-dependent methyltransferase